jgi:hypothetical protein
MRLLAGTVQQAKNVNIKHCFERQKTVETSQVSCA